MSAVIIGITATVCEVRKLPGQVGNTKPAITTPEAASHLPSLQPGNTSLREVGHKIQKRSKECVIAPCGDPLFLILSGRKKGL